MHISSWPKNWGHPVQDWYLCLIFKLWHIMCNISDNLAISTCPLLCKLEFRSSFIFIHSLWKSCYREFFTTLGFSMEDVETICWTNTIWTSWANARVKLHSQVHFGFKRFLVKKHVRFKKIKGPKKLCQKILVRENFGSKKIWVKKILSPKKLWVQ